MLNTMNKWKIEKIKPFIITHHVILIKHHFRFCVSVFKPCVTLSKTVVRPSCELN